METLNIFLKSAKSSSRFCSSHNTQQFLLYEKPQEPHSPEAQKPQIPDYTGKA